MPPEPETSIRQRLERLVTHDDPDVRDQAKALLGVLAVYDGDPFKNIPGQHVYAILARHLIKDEDVLASIDTRTLRPVRPAPKDQHRVPPADGDDPWDHRDHVVGEGHTHGDRREGRGTRIGDPAAPGGPGHGRVSPQRHRK